jgi:hypothetical protein
MKENAGGGKYKNARCFHRDAGGIKYDFNDCFWGLKFYRGKPVFCF